MTTEHFKNIVKTLPLEPGIYKYFDEHNELIYVGKAKNIKKRVSSYFIKTLNSYKTVELVRRIDRIEFSIVDTEQDAFLLENALIKEYQPRYNILLKDDKSYPFIIIKKEPFPRVFFSRKKLHDGSEHLGPYTSVARIKELLEFIKLTIPLRNCTLNLTDKNIEKKKFKVCLEYHLGNCKGPCEGFQSKEDYASEIDQLKNILKGNLSEVIAHFKKEIKLKIKELNFEEADLFKKKIGFLENYQAKSVIVSTKLGDVDVFSILLSEESGYVNYLMTRNGTIVQTHTIKYETNLNETSEEILRFSIAQIRNKFNSTAHEIIVPFKIDYPDTHVIVTVPKAGHKKKLLELSVKNANYFIKEKSLNEKLHSGAGSITKNQVLIEIQKQLQLPVIPMHIECFDNSNFQGSYPVSAMVSFKNGEPHKADYRLFDIKTVTGINDFASMKEAVYRRYKRLIKEDGPFPQLIIIDGGKGQLNAALEALDELNVIGKATIVGLAKNMEEVFFPGDKDARHLDFNSNALKLIRSIRDEVHRFVIQFHRNKRSKGTFKNELENIHGIGKIIAKDLLSKFRSVNKIKKATLKELEEVIGKTKAKLVFTYFQSQ